MANSEVTYGTKIVTSKAGEILAGASHSWGQELGDLWVNTAPTNENRPVFANDGAAARKWEEDIKIRCIYQGDTYGVISTTTPDTEIVSISGISLTLNSTFSYIIKFQFRFFDLTTTNTVAWGLKLNGTVINSTTTNFLVSLSTTTQFSTAEMELWLPYHDVTGMFGYAVGSHGNYPSVMLGLNNPVPLSVTSLAITGVSTNVSSQIYAGFVDIWQVF